MKLLVIVLALALLASLLYIVIGKVIKPNPDGLLNVDIRDEEKDYYDFVFLIPTDDIPKKRFLTIAPCKDCPDVGCGSYHDICPKYQEFKKQKRIEYEQRKVRSERKNDLDSVLKRRIRIVNNYSPRKQSR